MIEFRPFAHLSYVNQLRARLTQPLTSSLSDSSAAPLNVAQLLSLDSNAQQQLHNLNLGYASMQGSQLLRQAIIQLHQGHCVQTQLKPDLVATFSGVQEALFTCFNALLQPNDEIIAFTPNYPSLTALPQQLGAKVQTIDLQFDNAWQFDVDQLRQLINPRTRVIVVNFPHNPTGAMISSSQAKQIIELANLHGLYILADEVSIFSNVNNQMISYPWLDYPKSISFSVMSKSFGLAGIRVGWAISQDQTLIERMLQIKGYLSICGSASDEVLATTAINCKEQILNRNNQIISDNINAVDKLITNSHGQLKWHRPSAGIMTIVQTNLSIDVNQLAEKLAFNHQTLMLPGNLFGIKGDFFRLGLGGLEVTKNVENLVSLIANTYSIN